MFNNRFAILSPVPKTKELSRRYYLSNIEYFRNYYRERREKIRAYQKEYDKKNRERIKEHTRKYRMSVKERDKQYRRDRLLATKAKLVQLLGGKCHKCGDSDIRHLTFHHQNGGGSRDRMGLHRTYYYQKMIDDAEARAELTILCANCHSELHQGTLHV